MQSAYLTPMALKAVQIQSDKQYDEVFKRIDELDANRQALMFDIGFLRNDLSSHVP